MDQDSANALVGLVGSGISMVFALAAYVYICYCLMTIAKKTGHGDLWMAWVPIINFVLMLNIAKKPVWWIVLFLIPCVNIVFIVLTWMAIAEARGKPSWWGILMVVPCVNIIVPAYLAFSD